METPQRQTFTLAEFARLTGRMYAVVGIDGDTSEYVQVVKSDLLETLRARNEQGVVLARDEDGWLYQGVLYDEGSRPVTRRMPADDLPHPVS